MDPPQALLVQQNQISISSKKTNVSMCSHQRDSSSVGRNVRVTYRPFSLQQSEQSVLSQPFSPVDQHLFGSCFPLDSPCSGTTVASVQPALQRELFKITKGECLLPKSRIFHPHQASPFPPFCFAIHCIIIFW